MLEYTNFEYIPGKDDLVTEYYVEPIKGLSLEKVSQQIAAESSIGTWTTISTMSPDIAKRLKPTIFEIDKKTNIIKIAYPVELFEKGSIPQLLSSITGNIYGMKIIENLRLIDVTFPLSYVNSFKGPRYGIEGIRKFSGIKNRPFLGTIVKPKVGLNEKEHAKVAYNSWSGGLDVVKDDENLTSMNFNKFTKRMDEIFKLREKAEKETGEKKFYLSNVTAPYPEMVKRYNYVKELGGEFAMIDILTAGYSALQGLREEGNLALHGHRAMHAALTRNKKHGMSMNFLAKISRLSGIDQLHIGTAVGKMDGDENEVRMIDHEIEDGFIKGDGKHSLNQSWGKVKPTLAVSSGGLHPALLPKVHKIFGNDVVIQFGGGCHGHPGGTYEGAKAIRQACDASLKNESLKSYSKNHPELLKAIMKWGYD